MLKKLLTSFLVGLVLLFSIAPLTSTKASSVSWYNQTFPEWYLKVYDTTNSDEIFGERYTAAQVQWIVYSIPSLIINLVTGGNTDLGSCLVGAMSNNIDMPKCSEAVSDIAGGLGIVYETKDQPTIASQIFERKDLSGIGYVKNVFSKLNPVTTVSAQSASSGFGFSALEAIAFIWKITRNIAYFLFIIIAVVFAFMVMFRVKLSPQVVVTVQSVLPKLVIAIILVTFSFAIAGLLIDLMYVVMALLATFLATMLPDILGGNARMIFNFMNGTNIPLVSGGIALLVYFTGYLLLYIVALIAIAIAAVSGFNISSAVFAVLLLIFALVLILVLTWYILKTTFVLFKNLATVYGLVIIAPLQISLGAIYPQAGFGSWLKKFLAKLMVFPLTGAFIYLAMVLLIYSIRLSGAGFVGNNVLANLLKGIGMVASDSNFDISVVNPVGSWAPPLLGNNASAGGIAFLLMSVGLIMMIPKISESIDSFLAGKGIAGTAIGEAMGPLGVIPQGMQRGAQEWVGQNAGAYGKKYGAMGADKLLSQIPEEVRQKSKVWQKVQQTIDEWSKINLKK